MSGVDADIAEDVSAEHEGAEHEGAEHEGAEHEGAEHEGAEHEGAEHEGAEHEGAEHVGAEHEGEEHEGAEHEGAEHVGAEHVGAEHEGAEHVGAELDVGGGRRTRPLWSRAHDQPRHAPPRATAVPALLSVRHVSARQDISPRGVHVEQLALAVAATTAGRTERSLRPRRQEFNHGAGGMQPTAAQVPMPRLHIAQPQPHAPQPQTQAYPQQQQAGQQRRGPAKQVVVVVEGTASMGPSWALLRRLYLHPLLKAFCGVDSLTQRAGTAAVELALVVYHSHGSFS
ncbi:unnamed protein product, partial [Closterium sp. NIES-53]